MEKIQICDALVLQKDTYVRGSDGFRRGPLHNDTEYGLIEIYNGVEWEDFCDEIHHPELIDDETFNENYEKLSPQEKEVVGWWGTMEDIKPHIFDVNIYLTDDNRLVDDSDEEVPLNYLTKGIYEEFEDVDIWWLGSAPERILSDVRDIEDFKEDWPELADRIREDYIRNAFRD